MKNKTKEKIKLVFLPLHLLNLDSSTLLNNSRSDIYNFGLFLNSHWLDDNNLSIIIKDIILSYTDTRIIYIENKSNQGIVKTRNECIKIALRGRNRII